MNRCVKLVEKAMKTDETTTASASKNKDESTTDDTGSREMRLRSGGKDLTCVFSNR